MSLLIEFQTEFIGPIINSNPISSSDMRWGGLLWMSNLIKLGVNQSLKG